jgi:uncharacterized membrane protein YphA (DoxX/SURF4 family)
VEQDFALRIVLVVAGLSALAFGIANGFSHGWQLDIVNLVTIFAAIVLIVAGIFVKDIRRRK